MSSTRDLFARLAPFAAMGIADKNGERADFRGRISRKFSLLLSLTFVVVLLIAGISLLSAHSIFLSTHEIDDQTTHIEAIDEVHVDVHRLIFGLQESIINHIPFPEAERQKIVTAVKERLDSYAKREAMEEEFPEKAEELRIVQEIAEVARKIDETSYRLSQALASEKVIDQADLQYLRNANVVIPIMGQRMTDIHQARIDRSIDKSRRRIWIILGFYLALIIIGSLLILGSGIVFRKSVVRPISQLVSATVELSKGDFRKRVPVVSHDEIGQLAHSFNVMAERLEQHETTLQAMATLEERERIAQELHDSIAQDLGVAHLKLAQVEKSIALGGDRATKEDVTHIRKIIKNSYTDVREAIFGLRALISNGAQFFPALTEYLRDFSETRNIPIELEIDGAEAAGLSHIAEIQLIRIIQEALNNIFKHAQATAGRISFERDGKLLKITIQDNGKGFIPGEIAEKKLHFGLQTMKERARGLGGKLIVDSAPAKGTRVIVLVPREDSYETDAGATGR